jgi:hypothetical protein
MAAILPETARQGYDILLRPRQDGAKRDIIASSARSFS